jgi:hypothetical protein
MPSGLDSKIQAKVRILMARRWVDLRSVTIGTTNGVVYVGGALRAAEGPGGGATALDPVRRDAWRDRIRREIAAIPDVRDVVFQLEEPNPPGGA